MKTRTFVKLTESLPGRYREVRAMGISVSVTEDRNELYRNYFESNSTNFSNWSMFKYFKSDIFKAIYCVDLETYFYKHRNSYRGRPFYELFDMEFDSELDPLTTDKLLQDFEVFKSKCRALLDKEMFELYEIYQNQLLNQ